MFVSLKNEVKESSHVLKYIYTPANWDCKFWGMNCAKNILLLSGRGIDEDTPVGKAWFLELSNRREF
jgi:hypothetical protein